MTTGRGPRPRRPGTTAWLMLAVGLAVAAVRVGLVAAGPGWARLGLVVDAAAAVAAAVGARSVLAGRRDRQSRLAWVLLMAFPCVWLVAPVTWLVGAPDVVADVARAAAVLLVGGSWWFASRVGGTLSRVRPAVDGGIGAAAAVILAWHGPLADASAAVGGGVRGAVAVALPVAFVGTAVFGAAITVTEMRLQRWARPALFVAALLLMAASDLAWATGKAPFWAGAWATYAAAMRLQAGLTPRVVRVPTRGRLVYLPYALIVPSAVLLAVQTRAGDIATPQVGAGLAIVCLLVARQHVTLLENDRLVARLEETERLLRHRATHDSLTGLPGRAALHEHLATLAGAHSVEARPLAVAFADVDDFKTINDRYGHATGDAVLVEVAQRLLGALPLDDARACAARLGGDEFAVVVAGPGAADETALADRLSRTLNAGPVRVGAAEVQVRVSVGAALPARGAFVPSELLHEADLAMYAVKRARAQRPAADDDGPQAPQA